MFYAPSRGLIGYHGEFLTDTRGTGVMNRIFHEYGPYRGPIAGRRNGALIANAEATPLPMRCGTSRTAARCSSIPVSRFTRAW